MPSNTKPTPSIVGWAASGVVPSSITPARIASGMAPGEELPAAFYNLTTQFAALLDALTLDRTVGAQPIVGLQSTQFFVQTETANPPTWSGFPASTKAVLGTADGAAVQFVVGSGSTQTTHYIVTIADTGADMRVTLSGGGEFQVLTGNARIEKTLYVETTDAQGARYGYGDYREHDRFRSAHDGTWDGAGTTVTDLGRTVADGSDVVWRVPICYAETPDDLPGGGSFDAFYRITGNLVIGGVRSGGSATLLDVDILVDGVSVQTFAGVDVGDTLAATARDILEDEVVTIRVRVRPVGGTVSIRRATLQLSQRGVQ